MASKNRPPDPDATMVGGPRGAPEENAEAKLPKKPRAPEAFDPEATVVPGQNLRSAMRHPDSASQSAPPEPEVWDIVSPMQGSDPDATLMQGSGRLTPAAEDPEATRLRPPPKPAVPPAFATPDGDAEATTRLPPKPLAPPVSPPAAFATPGGDAEATTRLPPKRVTPPVSPPAAFATPDVDPEATRLRPPPKPAVPPVAPPPVSAPPASASPSPPEAPLKGLARFKDHVAAEGTVMMRRQLPQGDPEATAFIPTPGRRRGASAAAATPATPATPSIPVAIPAAPPAPAAPPKARSPAAPPPAAPPPAASPVSPPPTVPRPARGVDAAEAQLETLVGLNPLVAAANRLLSAVPQIRGSLKHPDPAALREELLVRVDQFSKAAAVKGYPEHAIAVARYALCALIDDAALHTPWGSAMHWDETGLLKTLEGDTLASAGERVFKQLDELEESPAGNIQIIEFFAVCLALGYEGRFAGIPGARVQIDAIWAKLQALIKEQRGQAPDELSVRWHGLAVPLKRRSPWFMTWVSACVSAAVLVTVYLGLRITLASSSEPAARALAALRAEVHAQAPAKGSASPFAGVLKTYLAKEIQSGKLVLQEDGMRSVVTVGGDDLFSSGSDLIDERYIPTVLKVAQALNKVPGAITIAGHTDDKPIRSARFPSNWDLSRERAMTVMKLMAGEIADPGRIMAEGLADSEPVAPNDSAENRARNRRVTAILRVAP